MNVNISTYVQLFISCHVRVVAPGDSKTIGPHVFTNWGSHHNRYPSAYFTVAAAVGMLRQEVDVFLERLDKVFVKFKKKHAEIDSECTN